MTHLRNNLNKDLDYKSKNIAMCSINHKEKEETNDLRELNLWNWDNDIEQHVYIPHNGEWTLTKYKNSIKKFSIKKPIDAKFTTRNGINYLTQHEFSKVFTKHNTMNPKMHSSKLNILSQYSCHNKSGSSEISALDSGIKPTQQTKILNKHCSKIMVKSNRKNHSHKKMATLRNSQLKINNKKSLNKLQSNGDINLSSILHHSIKPVHVTINEDKDSSNDIPRILINDKELTSCHNTIMPNDGNISPAFNEDNDIKPIYHDQTQEDDQEIHPIFNYHIESDDD